MSSVRFMLPVFACIQFSSVEGILGRILGRCTESGSSASSSGELGQYRAIRSRIITVITLDVEAAGQTAGCFTSRGPQCDARDCGR